MDYLGDTNVLLRRIQRVHPEYRMVREAINSLQGRGDQLYLVPQNLIEMWAVCTRPVESNGLGLLPTHVDRIISRIESIFPLLRDTANIYDEWRQLVVTYAVSGKKVHDARLVAAMNVHNVRNILTFNVKDFARYPNINVLHPSDLV